MVVWGIWRSPIPALSGVAPGWAVDWLKLPSLLYDMLVLKGEQRDSALLRPMRSSCTRGMGEKEEKLDAAGPVPPMNGLDRLGLVPSIPWDWENGKALASPVADTGEDVSVAD